MVQKTSSQDGEHSQRFIDLPDNIAVYLEISDLYLRSEGTGLRIINE